MSSLRSEPSRTVRHHEEFQHLEAELPFACIDDLLNHTEDLVLTFIGNTLTKPATRLARWTRCSRRRRGRATG